jgi:two-component system, OmpR family, response regulator
VGAKILVVEDDPTMAALIATGLGGDGHDVVVVGDGIQALIALGSDDFGAIAMDVMLPGMSGFELCRHLRDRGDRTPVLLLTARDAVEDRVFGLDSGADDYLTKPFDFSELSARIRALLRRDVQPARMVTTVGSVTFDSTTMRVSTATTSTVLSPKEFALLHRLAGNAGAVLSRDDILTAVWGSNQNIDPNVVEQYVSYLRRKLDPAEFGLRIVTVRGKGYRLESDE